MRTSLHLSFWFNYLVLWVILVVYTSIDVIIWPAYQSAGIPINLYDKLWFSFNYGLIAVSAITMLSVAIPVLIWLFNRLMVESLFYYILQDKLPPHNLPWLSLGTSTNLYLVSIAFILLSMALIYVELRWKMRLAANRPSRSPGGQRGRLDSMEALK